VPHMLWRRPAHIRSSVYTDRSFAHVCWRAAPISRMGQTTAAHCHGHPWQAFYDAMLQLTTFGGLGLRRDGLRIDGPLTQRRRLVLLAVLASEYPAAISRHALGALLWEAAAPDARGNSLRQAVFALRRGATALGEREEPVSGSAEITLNPHGIDADCVAFHRALEANDLTAVIALYRGPFLADVEFDDLPGFSRWAQTRRARYAAQFRRACAAAAVEASERGDWEAALDSWLALRTLEPDDPRAVHGLVTALIALGRVSEARQYEADVLPVETKPDSAASESPVPETPRDTNSFRRYGRYATRRNVQIGTALVAAVALGVLVTWPRLIRMNATASSARIQPQMTLGAAEPAVAVLPFRTNAADERYAYLHREIVDLLTPTFNDSITRARAVDPSVVLAVWDRVVGQPANDSLRDASLDAERGIGRTVGATRIVRGQVMGSSVEVTINADLVDVATGTSIATARVSGQPDSLPALVDRLAAQLLAANAGAPRY